MKILIVHGEEFEADKIVKNEENRSIVGYYETGGVRFAFRGINNWDAFQLAEGQEFDTN